MKSSKEANRCPVCGEDTNIALWKDSMYSAMTGRVSDIRVDVKRSNNNEYDKEPVYNVANHRVAEYDDKEFTLASDCTHSMFGEILPAVGAFCKNCGARLNNN